MEALRPGVTRLDQFLELGTRNWALLALMIGDRHQETEWHLERVGDFAGSQA